VTSPTSLSETHLPAERVVMPGARDRTQANRVTLSMLVGDDAITTSLSLARFSL
jgi:hypothetical protein